MSNDVFGASSNVSGNALLGVSCDVVGASGNVVGVLSDAVSVSSDVVGVSGDAVGVSSDAVGVSSDAVVSSDVFGSSSDVCVSSDVRGNAFVGASSDAMRVEESDICGITALDVNLKWSGFKLVGGNIDKMIKPTKQATSLISMR